MASAGGRRPADSVTILTVYVFLLIAIPSDLRIPALGGAGGLSALWAMGVGLWWCWSHLQGVPKTSSRRSNPVRIAGFILLAAFFASYVAANSRPLSVIEGSQADVGILRILAGLSIVFLASDSLPSIERMRDLLERIAWMGGGLAALGLAQFATGRSFVEGISIPGMVATQSYSAVVDRGGFTRSAGTAMSPLEYAAVLGAIMPIALTFALYDMRRTTIWRWLPAGLIGSALLVSGSRSALLALAAGVMLLFPSWNPRIRMRMAGIGIVAVAGMAVAVPGMIGTLRYLFTQTSNDPSAQSRSGSYEIVSEFVRSNPLFGRGFGTFLPEYRILDNAYLLLSVEVGLVGTCAFLALLVTSAVCASRARSASMNALDQQLGPALAASIGTCAVVAAFFDALSFPMAAGMIFLTAGLGGGYWWLAKEDSGAARLPAPLLHQSV